ncbi:MAG TPA: response regulator transcription factor [Solirubrobacteraceae bacterium]|jgi:DNA-binding NarL/FixJ family response regulator
MSATIRILIVDDDALVRSALLRMLGGAPDLDVVGEAADGHQAVEAVTASRPDVVLMDLRMPVLDGLAATDLIRALRDPPQVIVLTTFDADADVLRALRAGASGYLLKDTPPPEIVRAVRAVAAGEPMLSPAVTRRLIDHVTDAAHTTRRDRARELLARLTERERDVALGIGRGQSNAEIGAELFMSVATVKAHVTRVLLKLELDNRVQVALLTHDAGVAGG